MNWDDIRIFASISKEKSFSKAAKKNNTTQATISRRIQKLEEQLGYQLFERGQGGCTVTKAGEKLLKPASEMASWANIFASESNQISAQEKTVIITCGPALAVILSTNLEKLKKGTNTVSIEIKATPDYLDIEKGEADIAIRNRWPNSGTDDLKIKLLDIKFLSKFSIYGSDQYFSEIKINNTNNLNDFYWAGYTKNLSNLPSAQWLNKHVLNQQIQYKLNSPSLMAEVIQNHKVLAILPCSLGQTIPHLIELYSNVLTFNSDIWLIRRNTLYNQTNKIISHNIEKLLKSIPHQN